MSRCSLSSPKGRVFFAAALLLPVVALAENEFYVGAGAGGVRIEGDLRVTSSAADFGMPGEDEFVPGFDISSDGYEATDVGYRVFAGMNIGRYLGIEGGYVSFGSLEEDFAYQDKGWSSDPLINADPTAKCNPAGPPAGNCLRIPVESTINQDIDLEGWEFYAVGRYPFAENWEGFVKAGVLLWDLEFAANDIYPQSFPPQPPRIPIIDTTITNGCAPAGPGCPALSNEYDDDGTDLALGLGANFKASDHLTIRAEGEWFDIQDTDQAWLLGFDVIYTF
jgi:opacity protein-like surface antigen